MSRGSVLEPRVRSDGDEVVGCDLSFASERDLAREGPATCEEAGTAAVVPVGGRDVFVRLALSSAT